jgi:hypothetical protein
MGYGLIKVGEEPEAAFRKSDDKLIYITKFGISQTSKLKYTALADFRTQFTKGFKYSVDSNEVEQKELISEFLSPAFLVTGIGVEYTPFSDLYIFFSPLTIKTTIVKERRLSNIGAFGVKPGEFARKEFGAYLTTKYKLKLMENITLQTNVNLFSNYETMDEIDVFADLLLLMKVNKLVNVSFTTNLIYDDDITITRQDDTVGPALQVKEVLAVGLSFMFK